MNNTARSGADTRPADFVTVIHPSGDTTGKSHGNLVGLTTSSTSDVEPAWVEPPNFESQDIVVDDILTCRWTGGSQVGIVQRFKVAQHSGVFSGTW